MSSMLKGNFQPKNPVNATEPSKETESVETRFEREALKRLGGSIAFVSKKKIMWDDAPAGSVENADDAAVRKGAKIAP